MYMNTLFEILLYQISIKIYPVKYAVCDGNHILQIYLK
jgi:hypothetical protein